MDAGPAGSVAAPNGKGKHVYGTIGLGVGNLPRDLQGSPPKRAKTGHVEVKHTENPARGRLPVLNERETDAPAKPHLTLRVNHVSATCWTVQSADVRS